MNITKNIISRAEANKIAPAYVKSIEKGFLKNDFDTFIDTFNSLKRGQKVITFSDGKYIIAKVSSVDHNTYQAIDGPVVRVSNGEYSWRVDGDKYAWPIK